MSYDYTRTFAQDGQKAEISDIDYKGGWYNVVGGQNGIPTVQQFNAIMNEMEGKTNETHEMAKASKEKLEQMISYSAESKTITIRTKADIVTKGVY